MKLARIAAFFCLAVLAAGVALAAALVFVPSSWLEPLAGPPPSDAELRALHSGPPPCLRYPEPLDAQASRRTADALIAKGVTPETIGAVGALLVAWVDEREAAAHAEPMLVERMSGNRFAAWLARAALFASAQTTNREETARQAERLERAKAAWQALSESDQATLRAAFADQPASFSLPGLLALLPAMREAITNNRLNELMLSLTAFAERNHRFPARLADLELLENQKRDGWGNDIQYERNGNVAHLRSLGRDGEAGGTGPDADSDREVRVGGELLPEPLPAQHVLH